MWDELEGIIMNIQDTEIKLLQIKNDEDSDVIIV